MPLIERSMLSPVEISVTASESTSTVYNHKYGSSLIIERTAGSVATLTVYTTTTVDGSGTFKILKDRDGTAVTVTIDGTYIQAVSADTFPCGFLKFVGDTTGTIRVAGKS